MAAVLFRGYMGRDGPGNTAKRNSAFISAMEIPLLKPMSKNAAMMTISQRLYINPVIGGKGTPIPVIAGFRAIASAAKAMIKAIVFVFNSFLVTNYDE